MIGAMTPPSEVPIPTYAVERLRALCDGRPIVVFDLETTGTDRLSDRIVEVAALKVRETGPVEVLETRVNPEIKIPREATAIHGISDADVKDAPRFAEIADDLLDFLGAADLAGYNLRAFDVPLLSREFERAKRPFSLEGRRIVDAQTIFFKKEPRDLAAAVRLFAGREHGGAHNALADAVAALEVLAGELRRYPDLPATLAGLAEFSAPAEGRYVDPDKRFLWRDGAAVFAFGEHRGLPLQAVREKSPDYLSWILSKDFSAETKRIVQDALRGVYPSRS